MVTPGDHDDLQACRASRLDRLRHLRMDLQVAPEQGSIQIKCDSFVFHDEVTDSELPRRIGAKAGY
jgi:hypothetical protein